MVGWIPTLAKEEQRMRCVYKFLNGLIDADIRELHIPGDIRTKIKTDIEIKGWNRNGLLPLETWSVIERGKEGWGFSSKKLQVWFVRAETEEALNIPMESIRLFMTQTLSGENFPCRCKGCGVVFNLNRHTHPMIAWQDIQWTSDEEQESIHLYHSACLLVKKDAFPGCGYYGKPPAMKPAAKPSVQYVYLPITRGPE
jgi:hypothetical protein